MPKIVSINISERKGIAKSPIEQGALKEDWGLEGDVHSGPGDRQISLLAIESIQKQTGKCPKAHSQDVKLKPGDFGENITTEGVDLPSLDIGTKLIINEVVLEISKIGKECHRFCSIYYKTGDCIMPKEGVFARVLKGGIIKVNDKIKQLKSTC